MMKIFGALKGRGVVVFPGKAHAECGDQIC